VRKWKRRQRAEIWPHRSDVCIENNEYERKQQCLATLIQRVVILRNDHILTFCVVRTTLTSLNSFNIVRVLCPPHTFHTSLHMCDRPSHAIACATATNSNPHVLVQRSMRCTRGIHSKNVHLVYDS